MDPVDHSCCRTFGLHFVIMVPEPIRPDSLLVDKICRSVGSSPRFNSERNIVLRKGKRNLDGHDLRRLLVALSSTIGKTGGCNTPCGEVITISLARKAYRWFRWAATVTGAMKISNQRHQHRSVIRPGFAAERLGCWPCPVGVACEGRRCRLYFTMAYRTRFPWRSEWLPPGPYRQELLGSSVHCRPG